MSYIPSVGASGLVQLSNGGGGFLSAQAPLLIQTIMVSSGTASNFNFTGLNGNVDGMYKIYGRIVNQTTAGGGSASFTTWQFLPNGSAFVGGGNYFDIAAAGTSFGADTGTVTNVDPGMSSVFEITFHAQTGAPRWFRIDSQSVVSANDVTQIHAGFLSDTTTNITSLLLQGSNANQIIAGSYAALYRLPI